MANKANPGSGRKAHVAVETEIVNGVINHFVQGECNYCDNGCFAFTPNVDITQEAIWPIDEKSFAVLGRGWNNEAKTLFTAVEAVVHVYANGMIAVGLKEKRPATRHEPRPRTVRKRVVSTNGGIVRESPTDVTLRVRIKKDNLAASADSIRDLLDREVFKLLNQLPN